MEGPAEITTDDPPVGGESTAPTAPEPTELLGEPESDSLPPAEEPAGEPRPRDSRPGVMIPARSSRSMIETFFMRIIATAGIVGISVAIAAIMSSQKSHGWLIGLVASVVSVSLASILWSSQRL
jgi:hypothetical protein